jgi:hypothetical protein
MYFGSQYQYRVLQGVFLGRKLKFSTEKLKCTQYFPDAEYNEIPSNPFTYGLNETTIGKFKFVCEY